MKADEDQLICVDFDGVLTKGVNFSWDDGGEQPRDEVVAQVREAYYAGNHIIVWTARTWDQANHIAAWLTEHEVPYHGIRCEKGGADIYLDDKAFGPEVFLSEYDR